MTTQAGNITVANIHCDAEDQLLPLLKELTDKQMLGGWRLRKRSAEEADGAVWYLLKDGGELPLLPTHHFAAITILPPDTDSDDAVALHNARVEHLYNAINSTYGILYCHLSFKSAVT